MANLDDIREAAEQDLITFIRLVAPQRVLGSVHEELCRWWNREDAKTHQLTLLPRDHGKSALVAYRVAWELTRDPTLRVLYISATSNLAQKQLSFIKSIFTSDIHRRYWPDYVHYCLLLRALTLENGWWVPGTTPRIYTQNSSVWRRTSTIVPQKS
jgi:hypothetical protein